MSNYDEEPTFDDETPAEEEEEGSNRTFLISAGVLGGLVLLGLLCAAGYLFFSRNSTQQAESTAFAQATSQQATIQAGLTQTGIANAAAEALTQTAAPTNTVPPTNTPVIAEATFTPAGPSATQNPATATIAAGFTQLALSTQTVIATSTALPATGIADEVGAPGLLLMAVALVVVIFLVRRLRASPTK